MKNRRKEKHGSPMQEKMLMENDKRGVIPIYDSMFKKILTLSARAVIGLINGLFGTDYPPDSTITYNWTENHDDNLKRTIADTILTINGRHSYHMEAQMYEDEEIEFRVFDYGYRYALREGAGEDILRFPEPRVIQLYRHNGMPDTKTLILDFGIQGSFEYKIPVFKLLEHSIEELSRRRMIILIPFMLLKLRDSLKKERTLENMEALRKLVLDDIISVINENQRAGNITAADAGRLRRLIRKLYGHLYAHYKELAEGGLNDMMEEALVLDIDIIEDEITKRVTKQVTEEVTEEVTKRNREDTIKKLYSKLKDAKQVSELLDLPMEAVEKAL